MRRLLITNKAVLSGVVLTCILSLSIRCGYAQQPGELNFKLFNEQDGLSTSQVTGIVQDVSGYLWISTYDGLNRYDGYTFTIYRHRAGNANSIADNTINKLAIDYQGMLWLLLGNGTVTRFDPHTKKAINYLTPFKSTAEEGCVLFVDRKNDVWISKRNSYLYKLNQTNSRWYLEKDLSAALPDLSVNDIYEDEEGTLWITTRDGLYTYHDRKVSKQSNHIRKFPSWQNYFFGQILPDRKGGVWLTSYAGGLYYFNVNTHQWKNFLIEKKVSGTTNIINKIGWKNENQLWVATNGYGLGIFDIPSGNYQFVPIKKNAPGYLSHFFFKSFNDIIWVSSEKGISKLHPGFNLFSFIPQKVTYSQNSEFYKVKCVYRDTVYNKLYVATSFADGLHIINEKTHEEKIVKFPVAPSDEEFVIINSLYKDGEGLLWIVTRDFIYQMNRSDNTFKDVTPIRGNKFIQSPAYDKIIESKDGSIWITSSRNGFFQYNKKTKTFNHFSENLPDLKNVRLVDLAEDGEGRIWLASENHGIKIYDPKENLFSTYHNIANDRNSLQSDNVTGIIQSPSGNMWVTTLGGLSEADRGHAGRFKNFTTLNGLPSNTLLGLTAGIENVIWIIANSGLIAFNTSTKQFRQNNTMDGLDTRGNYESYYLGHDGAGGYYIGTSAGYYLFSDEVVKKKSPKSPLHIDAFKVFDKEINLKFDSRQSCSLNLNYDQNYFSIEFVLLNYEHPGKNTYDYVLEGFDRRWSYNNFRKYVNYTNLPPGSYTFRVRAAGASTFPVLHIYISPPFWRTWWFLSFTLIFIMGAIYGGYYYRVKHIISREKLKTAVNKKVVEAEMTALRAQMNPHFIFNCLNSINSYIIKSDIETASKYLTKFAKLIRLILKNSEDKMVPLENELSALKLYIELEALRFLQKFDYSIEVSSNLNVLSIYIPPLTIQPFVENAIWHGLLHAPRPGKLVIQISLQQNELICIIEDNGIGRKKAEELNSKSLNREKSFGMKITSDRLNVLFDDRTVHTNIEIVDLTGNEGNPLGTRVILKVPYKN